MPEGYECDECFARGDQPCAAGCGGVAVPIIVGRIQLLADQFEPTEQWPQAGANPNRAARAAFALAHVSGFYEWGEDYAFGDFLADFMHLCDALGVDFDTALDNGRTHYDAEKAGTDF